MACNLPTLQTAACASEIAKQNDRIKLLQWAVQITCEVGEAAGGAGVNVVQGYQGNYGSGVPPTEIPTSTIGIGYDTVTGQVWVWANGGWF